MARDVSVMFNELKAMADKHATLHADHRHGFRRNWTRRAPNWQGRGGHGGGGCSDSDACVTAEARSRGVTVRVLSPITPGRMFPRLG